MIEVTGRDEEARKSENNEYNFPEGGAEIGCDSSSNSFNVKTEEYDLLHPKT